MRKNFHAILSERDQEYTYHIVSTANLHREEVMDRIRFAMLGWDMRDLEIDYYKPFDDKEFSEDPGHPIYAVKVVLGRNPHPDVVVQKVSLITNIPNKILKVKEPGRKEEPESKDYIPLTGSAQDFASHLDKVGTSDADAKKRMGPGRLDAFMKELSVGRTERQKADWTKPVYEGFVTTHLSLSRFFGQGFKRGYYVVESYREDPSKLLIEGPFEDQPINYEFVQDLNESYQTGAIGGQKRMLNERVQIEAQVSRIVPHRPEEPSPDRQRQKYEVVVVDQTSGKQYPVVVDAFTENGARNKGVTMVSRETGVGEDRLLAIQPKRTSRTMNGEQKN